MQPISELDQKHTHIVCDRQQQFAEIFRLLCFLRDQVQFFQLGQAINQPADIMTEQTVDFRSRSLGILDGIVEKCGSDRRIVEFEVGENCRNLDRVRKIGVAGCPSLFAMRLHRIDVGAVKERFVCVRVVAPYALYEIVLPHDWRLSRRGRFLTCRQRRNRSRPRCPSRDLLLNTRKVGARTRHFGALQRCYGTTSRYHVVSMALQGFSQLVDKTRRPGCCKPGRDQIGAKYL